MSAYPVWEGVGGEGGIVLVFGVTRQKLVLMAAMKLKASKFWVVVLRLEITITFCSVT